MNIHQIKTYEEFLNQYEKKYNGGKCIVQGCDKPAYYEGGDARCYCPMCEEHAGIKESYISYLRNVKEHIKIRMKWDKDDPTLESLLKKVNNMLKEFKEEQKMKYICKEDKVPLILDPIDYSDSEWLTILKIFGMEEAERIVISDYVFEAYGSPRR